MSQDTFPIRTCEWCTPITTNLPRKDPTDMKRLEAVTVCVNYADFLEQTLPHNLAHFDHYLVVTSDDDRRTINLCQRLGVECRRTNLLHFDNDIFAKARAIDFGLAYLRRDDWVVHLDADVYLPPTTRNVLNRVALDSSCIYGVDRCDCAGYDAWRNSSTDPRSSGISTCRVPDDPASLPIGSENLPPQLRRVRPHRLLPTLERRPIPASKVPIAAGISRTYRRAARDPVAGCESEIDSGNHRRAFGE